MTTSGCLLRRIHCDATRYALKTVIVLFNWCCIPSHCTAKQFENVRLNFLLFSVGAFVSSSVQEDNLYQTCASNEILYTCNTHTHDIISTLCTKTAAMGNGEREKKPSQNELRMPSLLLSGHKINYSKTTNSIPLFVFIYFFCLALFVWFLLTVSTMW